METERDRPDHRRSSRRKLLVAGAVVLALGGVAVGRWAGRGSGPVTRGWDALFWEATGNHLDDEDLLRDAVDAVGPAPDAGPRVLFAGEVAEHLVVAVGVETEGCRQCVATVVDGEVNTDATQETRFRPIVFDPSGAALFAPLSLPDADDAAFLLHPRVGGVRVDAEPTGRETELLPSEDGVALVPRVVPGSSGCVPLVFQLPDTTADVYALLGDYLSVGIRANGMSEDARQAIAWGVAQTLATEGCDDGNRLLTVGEVVGDQTAVELDAGTLTEPVAVHIDVHQLHEGPLSDGRQGRALWLEWRRPGAAEPDTATVGWQEQSGAVHLAPVDDRLDELAAYRVETAPEGPIIVVTGRIGVRDDLVRVDADEAEVLASGPGVAVLELQAGQHVVTLYGAQGQLLDALAVVGG